MFFIYKIIQNRTLEVFIFIPWLSIACFLVCGKISMTVQIDIFFFIFVIDILSDPLIHHHFIIVFLCEFLSWLNSFSFLGFGLWSCVFETLENYFRKWVITSNMPFDIEQVELVDDFFGTYPDLKELSQLMEG